MAVPASPTAVRVFRRCECRSPDLRPCRVAGQRGIVGSDRRNGGAMFKTLVVALDLEPDGDRALPVAAALARAGGLAVDLVTVSSPGLPPAADAYELERRAHAYGWGPDSWSVV